MPPLRFFYNKSKTNEEVMEYYKNNLVDLFVNMSESEGLPVSMMEAMSFGVPVIAPDVGGIKEIVDENSGWLLSCENCSAEFVEVINTLNSLQKGDRIILSLYAELQSERKTAETLGVSRTAIRKYIKKIKQNFY